jgi:hypothetical protein
VPNCEQLVQQRIDGRTKARRSIADQRRFHRLGTGGSGNQHARHGEVPLRAIRHGEEDGIRVAAAYSEDPAHLGLIATLVLHDAQNVGHGHGWGGGPIHQPVDNHPASRTLKGRQRSLGWQNG